MQLKNRTSIVDQVGEHLLDAIMSGELHPGERIIEAKVAHNLGVGQSTLREALQGLEHKGLLTKYPNRGTFVTKLTETAVEEIYVIRMRLEPLAASMACQQMTEQHHSQLLHCLEKKERAEERRDFKEMMKSDLAFHQLIWRAANNSMLERVLELICAPLFALYVTASSHFQVFSTGTAEDFKSAQQDHLRLFTALTSRDPQLVERVFQETLEIFKARHLKHVREVAEDREPPRAVDSGAYLNNPEPTNRTDMN